jgi:hypothetical protein
MKEKQEKPLIDIPGTNFAIKRYSHGWELWERRDIEKRDSVTRKPTGEVVREYVDPVFPVDFAHAAKIISEHCATDAPDVVSMLNQIVFEREKLSKVLTEIIEKVAGK